MSTKVKKCREPARVTLPAPEEEEDGEAEGGVSQRRRRGWRGVNGGLEPPGPRAPPSPGPDA